MSHHLLRGFGISLLLHGVALCFIIYMAKFLPNVISPLVIDFSIEKNCSNCQSCNCSKKFAQIAQEKAKPKPKIPVKKVPPVSRPEPVKEKVKKVEVKKPEPRKPETKKPVPQKIIPVKAKKRPQVEERVMVAAFEPIPEPVPEAMLAEVPGEESEATAEEFAEQVVETFSEKGPSSPQEVAALLPAAAPRGQVASPSPEEQYIKAHFSYIRDTVQRNTNYPGMARRMGWEGKVLVSFIVCADGQVEDIRVLKSCGFNALDKNAIKTIRQCAPFPKPPVRAEVTLPITYRLN